MRIGPWVDELRRAQSLPLHYAESVQEHVARLAERIVTLRRGAGRPVVVGIAGAQGCGKSTLALFLANWLKLEEGVCAATLGLDDLYFDPRTRIELARTIHPLLRTRGVPGTHDVAAGERLLRQLTAAEGTVLLPRFDKAVDDLRPRSEWTKVATPVDVVLFEGWCVGARPQSDAALETPINTLESDEDPYGRWRRYVNEQLRGDYARLFARLDMLLFLRVPSFSKVLEWRGLQEDRQDGPLDDAALRRFVQHFERLSRHMLETVPDYADAVIDIDDDHRMIGPHTAGQPA